ncbi:exported solute-binding protein [Allostella vacuolata]|nr:exported solute-binding protein [Stella vacuolata]
MFALQDLRSAGNSLGRRLAHALKRSAPLALAAAALALPAPAPAKTLIRIQSVIPVHADEVVMLKDFARDVSDLTGGEVTFTVLPAGAVVGVNETLDAVDKGLIEAGFAWTHYWSGKHPAATLFGSPAAGAGVGLDNLAWVSWYLYGGGAALYDRLWDEMGVNVKGFILQPVGPEPLGWFRKPIASLADFKGLRFRAPPGIPGQIYNAIGVAAVALPGGEILPALERGVIDAAEWAGPKPDSVFGFQKVLKHYYLQGLHQNVVNADIYINKDVWKKLTALQQKAIEVSANAAMMKAHSYRIIENGRALKQLVEKDGVVLHDTPKDFLLAYADAAQRVFQGHADRNPFFKEVWDSQRRFAEQAIPFWASAQKANAAITGAYADKLAGARK